MCLNGDPEEVFVKLFTGAQFSTNGANKQNIKHQHTEEHNKLMADDPKVVVTSDRLVQCKISKTIINYQKLWFQFFLKDRDGCDIFSVSSSSFHYPLSIICGPLWYISASFFPVIRFLFLVAWVRRGRKGGMSSHSFWPKNITTLFLLFQKLVTFIYKY